MNFEGHSSQFFNILSFQNLVFQGSLENLFKIDIHARVKESERNLHLFREHSQFQKAVWAIHSK